MGKDMLWQVFLVITRKENAQTQGIRFVQEAQLGLWAE